MASSLKIVSILSLAWLAAGQDLFVQTDKESSTPETRLANQSARAPRRVQILMDDFEMIDGRYATCPQRAISDAWSLVSPYYQQHYEIIDTVLEVVKRWTPPVFALFKSRMIPLPETQLQYALLAASVSQIHAFQDPESTPAPTPTPSPPPPPTGFLPIGDRSNTPLWDAFDCDNQDMEKGLTLAGLSENEQFFFSSKLIDLVTYAKPFLSHCGPLPGAWYHHSQYVAPSDKTPLERMCAVTMSEDNLHLCLGDGNVMQDYLAAAARGYEQAAWRLEGLYDEFVQSSPGHYGPVRENDPKVLQLVESAFLWRFGLPRIGAMVDYANLITACYTEKPANTNWGAENGAVGWTSLEEQIQALRQLTETLENDIDRFKDNAVRAALRKYKEDHIRVIQTTVCRTKNNRRPKVYVALRDSNWPMLQNAFYPKIDLSLEDGHGLYDKVPYSVARECFSGAGGCNKDAKRYPMYTNSTQLNNDWRGGHPGNFAVGCYSAGSRNADKIADEHIKDHWQPEHVSSVRQLERLEENRGGHGIGYGVDVYLKEFIKPLFEEKYHLLISFLKQEMATVRAHAIAPMEKILEEHRPAHEAYVARMSRSNLRSRNMDTSLASSTRLTPVESARASQR